VIEEQTDDQPDDDRAGEHPTEAHEIAAPKARVRLFVGHPLRSLSWVCTARKSISPTRSPRGLGDARKLSQRDRPLNAAGRGQTPVHTGPGKRVTGRSVVMSGGLICAATGCL
jgi:hypothetical protein